MATVAETMAGTVAGVIADHAVSLARRVVYLVTGQTVGSA